MKIKTISILLLFCAYVCFAAPPFDPPRCKSWVDYNNDPTVITNVEWVYINILQSPRGLIYTDSSDPTRINEVKTITYLRTLTENNVVHMMYEQSDRDHPNYALMNSIVYNDQTGFNNREISDSSHGNQQGGIHIMHSVPKLPQYNSARQYFGINEWYPPGDEADQKSQYWYCYELSPQQLNIIPVYLIFTNSPINLINNIPFSRLVRTGGYPIIASKGLAQATGFAWSDSEKAKFTTHGVDVVTIDLDNTAIPPTRRSVGLVNNLENNQQQAFYDFFNGVDQLTLIPIRVWADYALAVYNGANTAAGIASNSGFNIFYLNVNNRHYTLQSCTILIKRDPNIMNMWKNIADRWAPALTPFNPNPNPPPLIVETYSIVRNVDPLFNFYNPGNIRVVQSMRFPFSGQNFIAAETDHTKQAFIPGLLFCVGDTNYQIKNGIRGGGSLCMTHVGHNIGNLATYYSNRVAYYRGDQFDSSIVGYLYTAVGCVRIPDAERSSCHLINNGIDNIDTWFNLHVSRNVLKVLVQQRDNQGIISDFGPGVSRQITSFNQISYPVEMRPDGTEFTSNEIVLSYIPGNGRVKFCEHNIDCDNSDSLSFELLSSEITSTDLEGGLDVPWNINYQFPLPDVDMRRKFRTIQFTIDLLIQYINIGANQYFKIDYQDPVTVQPTLFPNQVDYNNDLMRDRCYTNAVGTHPIVLIYQGTCLDQLIYCIQYYTTNQNFAQLAGTITRQQFMDTTTQILTTFVTAQVAIDPFYTGFETLRCHINNNYPQAP